MFTKLYRLVMDLLKCQCESWGYCPVFGRTMEKDPPNWEWCQKTTPEERKKYQDLLKKAPPSANKEIIDTYQQYEGDKKFFFLDYLTLYDNRHCKKANNYQRIKNRKIKNYININKNNKQKDFDNVEILVVGHKEEQFASIIDRNYLKKININEVSSGPYGGKTWSESRAFLLNNIFRNDSEWIGNVSASWNLKYEPFSRIDNLHNWHTSELLINSKPEDKLFLCADITCPCIWFDVPNNVLSNLVGSNDKLVGQKFMKAFGFKEIKHIKVPCSHQMITHRGIYFKYADYLISNDIFGRVKNFIDDIEKYFKDDIPEYSKEKLNGYFMEMFSYFWLAEEDMLYIPNAKRRDNWYSIYSIARRTTKV